MHRDHPSAVRPRLPALLPRMLMTVLIGITLPAGVPALASDVAPSDALARAWPAWRGPLGNGVSPRANPPVQWSETNHVRWKIPLAGQGHASPVVFGDHVYLLAAVPVGEARKPVHDSAPGVHDSVPVTHVHRFVALAIRRADGRIAWQTTLREEFPHEGGHETGSLASASPVTDGESLFAFLGSRGLHALGSDGQLRWSRDLGRMSTLHSHGEGSSPVVHGDTLVVCWDHEGASFLHALDKRTGAQRWKVARDEKTSWATPLIVVHQGRPQVICSATKRVRSYDLETGALLWECGGLTDNVVASPVHADGLVIAGNSYYRQAMFAVRLEGARGDLTNTDQVVWRLNRMTPYVASPLLYGDTLYFLRHNQNILSRHAPATGRPRGEPLRLEAIGDFIFASPVGAANRIYIAARDGTTVVLGHSRENPVLAVNRLADAFSATPAPVDDELYLRGERFLYCLSER